jgi:arsenate reductase-like glutaredoxin family protein
MDSLIKEKDSTFIKSRRIPWSSKEDESLIHYLKEKGNLKGIEKMLPNRTQKQAEDRYRHYLSCDRVDSKWTKEEIEQVKILYLQHCGCWSLIKKSFPNRNQVDIKNICNSLIKRGELKNICQENKVNGRKLTKSLGRNVKTKKDSKENISSELSFEFLMKFDENILSISDLLVESDLLKGL